METVHATAAKIVQLFDGKSPMTAFPSVAQVDAYWEGLRRGRLMPLRSEVDPRGLEDALEFAFMAEHVGAGVARLRVAGMHLSDLLGMEVRGMPLTAYFDPVARAQVSRTVERVITEPLVADLRLTAEDGIGRPALEARMYLAPLATEVGGAARILGCLQSVGAIGRTPRRFRVGQVQLRRIVAVEEAGMEPEAPVIPPRAPAYDTPSETPEASAPRAERKTGGLAETAAAFRGARATKAPVKPHLTLVKNGD